MITRSMMTSFSTQLDYLSPFIHHLLYATILESTMAYQALHTLPYFSTDNTLAQLVVLFWIYSTLHTLFTRATWCLRIPHYPCPQAVPPWGMRTHPQSFICQRIQLHHLPPPFPHHWCCSLFCYSFALRKWMIDFLHRSPPSHWLTLSLPGNCHLLKQLPCCQCQPRFACWLKWYDCWKLSSRRGLWHHPCPNCPLYPSCPIHPHCCTTKWILFPQIPSHFLHPMKKEHHHIYCWAGLYPHHQQCSLHIGSNSKTAPSTFHQSYGTCSGPCSNPINHKHGWLSPFSISCTPYHHYSHRIQQLGSNHSDLMLHMLIHQTPLPQLSPLLLPLLWTNCSWTSKLQVSWTSLLLLWAVWSLPCLLSQCHVPQPWPFHGCNLGSLPLWGQQGR